MPRPVPAVSASGRGVATPGSRGSGTTAGRELPAERDVASRVARLAWPVIGEQLLLTLVGVVDIAMVGRLGASAVAGVGAATQLVQLAVSSMGAFSVGTTVLVAQATGARRPGEAAHVTRQSLLAGLAAGVVLAIVGASAARPLIRLLGPEADVVETGALFLRLDALALPALVAMLVAGGALRGAGDTRTPLVASAVMNAINLALAYVLVFGKLGLPALGVAGVALASVIARTAGAAILVVLLFRRRGLSFRSAGWWPDLGVVRRVLRIGVPTAVEQSMLSGGFLLYGALVIALGTTVYATQRLTFQAINLAFMPAFGYATATTTLTGQSLGAGRPDLARAATAAALRQALFWMTLFGIVFAVFAGPMMALFSSDPEVIAIGKVALPVLALAQPLWAVGHVYAGSLRGAGDARFPMVATSAGMWLIRLPTAYLFGIVLGWGLPGVYLSSTFDAGLRALLNYLRHRSGRWQAIKI